MSYLVVIMQQSGGFALFSLAAAVLVAVALALPLWRGRSDAAGDENAKDVAIYRAQIAEIDRDLERGLLQAGEAARARTEVARRLLAADVRPQGRATDAPSSRIAVLATVLAIVGGSAALYLTLGAPLYPDLPLSERHARSDQLRANRPSQDAAEAVAAPLPLPADAAQETLEAVLALERVLEERPDLLEGWQMLAPEERALMRFSQARVAMENVIRLRGQDATIAERMEYVDMMVAAAGLYVSPEAEAQVRQVLKVEPENFSALFYLGLMYAQTDRADLAFQIWRPMLDRTDGNILHMGLLRDRIERAAFDAGIDFALPPAGAAAVTAMGGDDQQAMIRGMVAGLAERLATQGGTPEDWARLITSYGVLGETERARAIWTEAQAVFADSPAAIATISAAATQAGVAE